MQLFAILGSHPKLSVAELETVLGAEASLTSETVSVFDDVSIEPASLQRRLGGTQKVGSIIGAFQRGSKDELAEFLASQLLADVTDGKIFYGISVYALDGTSRTQELRDLRAAIGLEVKKILKLDGRSARYVINKQDTLTAVDIAKNKLLTHGAEFVFLAAEKQVLIGKTEAVQDFENWSHRDYQRPSRDAKRGMLPPKLARIMVNLTGIHPEGAALLDPFCGSGTVLMEAALVGFRTLYGSDISPKAVDDTRQNLEWLEHLGTEIGNVTLNESTAANTNAMHVPESIDAIVTEPFLGTPRQGSESVDDVEDAIDEIVQLYKESFASLASLLKPGGTIVVASPVHFVGRDAFPVPTRDILKSLGLKELPIADEPVVYRREGQFVGREVVRFGK